MNLPAPQDILYFLEIEKTLNISRAAERLGISQPSLSLSIQKLEYQIGTPLLIRSKTGVQLTKSGKNFIKKSKLLLQQWEELKKHVHEEEHTISGRFSIGCHASVALYTLPVFLPALLKQNLKLDISLEHNLSRKITNQVINFEIDFGLVVNPSQHPDLVLRPLCKDEVMLFTSKKFSQTNDITLIIQPELNQTQFILNKLKKEKLKIHRIIETSSLEVIASLVASGAGIGILPKRVAQASHPGALKPYLKDSPIYTDQISLIYRVDAQKTYASKAIINFIVNQNYS